MEKKDQHRIPAASIGDIDLVALARTDPDAASEIHRIERLMSHGNETKAEFRTLCQMLFNAGAINAAEILLRRNLGYYDGHALYVRLFGNEKSDEFNHAIEAFKSQFSVELHLAKRIDFLVLSFHSHGCAPRSDEFALLSRSCEIKFGYIEQTTIEADVTLKSPAGDVFQPDECMLLFFKNGVWEIRDSTE